MYALHATRGLSLLELLVALLLTALIASIAVPNFSAAVRKSRRLEAEGLLMGLHLRQAQWRAGHATYATTLDALQSPAQSGAPLRYRLSLTQVTATGYRLRAEALAGAGSDRVEGIDCSNLEIDQTGARSPERCWR